jgi:hypothetical protein
MKKEWYNKLPWIGLISGLLMVILLVMGFVFRPTTNTKNTINRKLVIDKLHEIKIDSKEALNSIEFADNLNKTLDVSAINTKWLISSDGLIVYASGMMAQSTPLNTSIYDLTNDQNLGLIYAVEGNMDEVQKKILYAAATIRKEGDHNNIYGHTVVPLKTSGGELVGFIGVAYDIDASTQSSMIYIIDIALIICFLVYWLSFPLWVYFDCRQKDNKYIFWTLFVLIGNLPAYIAYFITKKQ